MSHRDIPRATLAERWRKGTDCTAERHGPASANLSFFLGICIVTRNMYVITSDNSVPLLVRGGYVLVDKYGDVERVIECRMG